MVLVDTSVWIGFFSGRSSVPVDCFRAAIEQRVPFALTALIYQEILQGAGSDKAFEQLKGLLDGQRMLEPKHGVASHERAARIYFDCRRLGITIRSTIDCITAQVALEHDAMLLHDDRDFPNIGKVVPQLRLAPS